MSHRIPHRILSALTDNPWVVTQDALAKMIELAARYADADVSKIQALRTTPGSALGQQGTPSAQVAVRGTTAVISIRGPIVRYASWINDVCGIASYDDIIAQLGAAMANPMIRQIVLEIDSPGGEVSGCAETARAIANACATKPVHAYVDGDCCSAAYWLASPCDSITGYSTSNVGCVGVVAMWTDTSERDEKSGVKQGRIVSSQTPFKIDDPKDADGLARLQARIDATADAFLDDLSEFRQIPRDQIAEKTGKGTVYVGQQALDAGMIDDLSTFEDLLESLEDSASSSVAANPGTFSSMRNQRTSAKDKSMAKPLNNSASEDSAIRIAAAAAVAAVNAAEKTKTDNDTDVEPDEDDEDETPAGKPKGKKAKGESQTEKEKKDMSKEAATAERTRINAIMTAPEATGREDLAKYFAFETDDTSDRAIAALKRSPVAASAAPAAPAVDGSAGARAQFDAALAAGNPAVTVGAGTGESASEDDKALAFLGNAAKSLGLA